MPGVAGNFGWERRMCDAPHVMRTDAGVVGALPAALLRSASDQRLVEHVRAGSQRCPDY
jgi:hypothetical protein